jgi:hypothetical protein
MFPRGAPGLALLLLRLFAGAELVADAKAGLMELHVVVLGVLIACALAIVMGLATPIASILAAIIEAIVLYAHGSLTALHPAAPIVIGVALALLGPGACSIDARLFGRRLLEFDPNGDKLPPTQPKD